MDPNSKANQPETTNPLAEFDAVIIGAGFAGMYMLHKLRQLGLTCRVLEKGSGVGGTPAANKLSILSFPTSCQEIAGIGECKEAYSWPVDPKSTAHFSAINERTKDVYLCEVTTNQLKKYTYTA